jgi:hypothetical protein
MTYIAAAEWQLPNTGQSPYFTRNLEAETASVGEFFKICPMEAFTTIPDVLTQEALDLLNGLEIESNSKYDLTKLLAHPVSRALVSVMGKLSLSNGEYGLDPNRVSASMRNESGEDISVGPHRDLLDGHAVLFNWAVRGDLNYVIDGAKLPVTNNQILVINGATNWQEVTSAVYSDLPKDFWRFGGTTAVHAVTGTGYTSRNRLLVYADGEDTAFTQIFEDEYGPVPEVKDNLLFLGLRPSLGFYIE